MSPSLNLEHWQAATYTDWRELSAHRLEGPLTPLQREQQGASSASRPGERQTPEKVGQGFVELLASRRKTTGKQGSQRPRCSTVVNTTVVNTTRVCLSPEG